MSTLAAAREEPVDLRPPVPMSAAEPVSGRLLHRSWRTPLVIVVVALIVLATAPLVVSRVVYRLRQQVIGVDDPAQSLVNDVEADLALQMFAVGALAQGGGAAATANYRKGDTDIQRDLRALDSLVRRIDPEAAERFADLRDADRRWRAASAPVIGVATTPPPVRLLDAGEEALAAAEHLDAYLTVIGESARAHVRSIERLDIWLPAVLVPLALLSVVLTLRIGERIMEYANDAELSRTALARAVEAKAQLLRGVSHDLKNPLGAAMGYADLLGDGVVGPLSPEQHDVVLRLRRLLEATLHTLTDLLSIARTDESELRVERRPTDLGALTAETVDDFRASARASELALELAPPARELCADTDPERVRQILGNLLSNALKYTPRGGRVHVRAYEERAGNQRWACVEVRDTGPGIPPQYRERVFEEFFRLPHASSVASGEGVGLAISRRIARLLGGDLTVADPPPDQVPGGARLVLRLPVAAGPG
ncbi:MAG TPA: HAMP domain-containing sensor histidine kinase [Gemmatimonadaceae bacterium]|nr:HAMP domain-containing sensor histidine kinase [Gemmatimonadaceae bacterium]